LKDNVLVSLREHDVSTWESSESQLSANGEAFAEIIEIHFELLRRCSEETADTPTKPFDRAMRLMAAKCTHLLRAAWIAAMCGYQGAYQPLVRALHETSLTMYYLRRFPGEFSCWNKEKKTSEEEKKFWPSSMMTKLGEPDSSRLIINSLAENAHATVASLGLLGEHDPETGRVEISIGIRPHRHYLVEISGGLCMFGAIAAYTIGRTVKDSLVPGIAGEHDLVSFFQRLDEIVRRRQAKIPLEGVRVFELLRGKKASGGNND
jgi:hypothetical protein